MTLVFLNGRLLRYVLKVDETVGFVRYITQEWDDDAQRWCRADDDQVIEVSGEFVQVLEFETSSDLQKHFDAYHAGYCDAFDGNANWGGALYEYQFSLRDLYDLGYRAYYADHP